MYKLFCVCHGGSYNCSKISSDFLDELRNVKLLREYMNEIRTCVIIRTIKDF